ncbi:unnamed protein product, partial [Brachionus calyciflorus]
MANNSTLTTHSLNIRFLTTTEKLQRPLITLSQTLNKTDYYYYISANDIFLSIFFDQYSQESLVQNRVNDLKLLIDGYLTPIICLISLILNIFCIMVFTNEKVTSQIYKYLLANSLFDTFNIVVSILREISKYRTSFFLIFNSNYLELYFYTYLTSVTLTCSNLIKIAFSLERYFRLKRKCNIYLRKSSFKWIILNIIAFSIITNSLILFSNNFYADYWSRKNIFFMTLNRMGYKSKKGIALNFLAIFLDVGIFLIILIINLMLLREISLKSKWIARVMEENNGADFFQANPETSEINEDEEDRDEVSIDICPSYVEDQVKLEQNRQDKIKKLSIENSIRNTSKMIVSTIILYIVSHVLFTALLIWIQFRYYVTFGPMLNRLFDNYYLLKFFISL